MNKEFNKEFKLLPNTGNLFSSSAKKTEKSPDYWGEFALSSGSIKVVDGVATIKISGWKKTSKNGKTYLALKLNEWKPEQQTGGNDEDPFK